VYVLAGAVVSQVGKPPPHTFTQGQMWSELPYQQHMVSKNASSTQPAKLLVFLIVPHTAQLTTFLAPSAK
jgi:quercetin dioxygenase-like cupin family protein